MRYPHLPRHVAILALAGVAAIVFAAAASAGKATLDAFQHEGTYVLDDYCGVPDLDVRVDFSIGARFHVVPHGRDQLSYFLQHGTRTETLTNPANGRTLRSVARVTEKDLRVTDNGDGTLTILVLATGNATLYGADGKAIARNPGQLRFELLFDDGGTPGDPWDDEVIQFLGVVKDSTGRSDDFCAAAVPALT
jgi:hypothetical protein